LSGVATLPAYWALAVRTARSESLSRAIAWPNNAISSSPSFLATLRPIPVRPDLGRFPRPTAQGYGTGCVNSGLSRLPRLGEQSAPVGIRRGDEASRHVVAE
jgi:hypothetical protein